MNQRSVTFERQLFLYALCCLLLHSLGCDAQRSQQAPTIRDVENRASPNPSILEIRVVDEAGHPIEGAEVGTTRFFGDMLLRDTGWEYFKGPVVSNADGIATFQEPRKAFNREVINAFSQDKELVGVASVDAGQENNPLTVTLHPACHVRGQFICPELEKRGLKLSGTGLSVFLQGRYVIERWDKEPHFEFVLPVGDYQLECMSLVGTHRISLALSVPADTRDLTLDPIQLTLTNLKRLELDHAKAPELKGIVGWKNSEALTLADLRGNIVLLDFWGYWCPSCISKMRQLFELHDRFSERGLVIIGIHIDAGDDISTVRKLDEKVKPYRESHWNGRDIPFPVAMVRKDKTSFGVKNAGSATCEVAASYGITHYPTLVLIDEQGNVVGEFDIKLESEVKRLATMLDAL